MVSTFKDLVSELYTDWEACLMPSLTKADREFFESICLKTASPSNLRRSLYKLSRFLNHKFNRKVIVLIDEYEAPNNCAYEHGYFKEVRFIYPSL